LIIKTYLETFKYKQYKTITRKDFFYFYSCTQMYDPNSMFLFHLTFHAMPVYSLITPDICYYQGPMERMTHIELTDIQCQDAKPRSFNAPNSIDIQVGEPGCRVVTPGAERWPRVLGCDPGCWAVTQGTVGGGWPRVLGLLAQSLVGQPHCCESNSWPSYITFVLIWS